MHSFVQPWPKRENTHNKETRTSTSISETHIYRRAGSVALLSMRTSHPDRTFPDPEGAARGSWEETPIQPVSVTVFLESQNWLINFHSIGLKKRPICIHSVMSERTMSPFSFRFANHIIPGRKWTYVMILKSIPSFRTANPRYTIYLLTAGCSRRMGTSKVGVMKDSRSAFTLSSSYALQHFSVFFGNVFSLRVAHPYHSHSLPL